MHTIFLALGTNLGDREKNIKEALKLLKEKVIGMKLASIYESKPQGRINQGNFLNSALKGKTSLSPQELLHFVKGIERKMGRVDRGINGPREIDIDILFYDDIVLDTPDLKIPHPRISERDFVLRPLLDLAPVRIVK